uniref:NADH dehydrogenase [ubiquinone] 1 alpha subcomplex subunit 4 n=1 Tax=Steinernema glaseri TaxID=37863 RepID=A0A1I7ZDW4_9BILA
MVSLRTARMLRRLKGLPRELWNLYPEQVALYSTFGVAAAIIAAYKVNKYGTEGIQPYYRGRYDIVRTDNPVALNWRVPEEYPAPYLSNRDNVDYSTYKRDYGYKAAI